VLLGAELGRGQSGVVFQGAFSTSTVNLAIKTRGDVGLDVGGAAALADEALMLEAMVLNGLRHPGIVTLLAVVTVGAPVLVCTELMENGDLRDYLRACRPRQSLGVGAGNDIHQPTIITLQVMVAMAAKLSSAMAFLEQQSIIHRDIAARNVLVGKDPTAVKMADLGAARNVHRTREGAYSGVYTATTDHSPARWMPLEALREARFSHKSDVFAFGVLLWEILTLGQTPWGAFGVLDFTQALAKGTRLACPTTPGSAPDDAHTCSATKIYAIALRCWKEDPVKRPHFHQLEAEFAIQHTVLATNTTAAPSDVVAVSDAGRSLAGSGGYLVVGRGGAEPSSRTLDANQFIAGHDVDARELKTTEWNVADAGTAQAVALDNDGYVADVGIAQAALDNNSYVADVGTAQATLDDDGYVADVGTAQATLDDDGYVADVGTAQATLDGNGYVADVGTAQVLTPDAVASERDACARSTSGCEGNGNVSSPCRQGTCTTDASSAAGGCTNDGTQLEGGRLDAGSVEHLAVAFPLVDAGADSERQGSADSARKGVAARSARQPSLYLGFGGGGGDPSSSSVQRCSSGISVQRCSSGSGVHDEDETRL
jgi:hypothetical protein